MTSARELFDKFSPVIAGLSRAQLNPSRDRWASWMDDALLLHEERHGKPGRLTRLAVYYAPFDHVSVRACVAIVGITPGAHQMLVALRTANESVGLGLVDWSAVSSRAKQAASFSGPMRRKLVGWMDDLGIGECLDVGSCQRLFDDENWDLVHTTSVARYPAFLGDENYRGHNPAILRSAMLRPYADWLMAEEIAKLPPTALIIPLGTAVRNVLQHYIDAGTLDPARCLLDFQHPSDAIGAKQREERFRAAQRRMREQVRRWFAEYPVPSPPPVGLPGDL
jgi:hypothetical protein